MACLLVGTVLTRLWLGDLVTFQEGITEASTRPIFGLLEVTAVLLPLVLYLQHWVKRTVRSACAILLIALLFVSLVQFSREVYWYNATIFPARWMENRWLFRAVVDPTFIPSLILTLGAIQCCVRIVAGHTVSIRFTTQEMLIVVLLLSLCLAVSRAFITTIPKYLESSSPARQLPGSASAMHSLGANPSALNLDDSRPSARYNPRMTENRPPTAWAMFRTIAVCGVLMTLADWAFTDPKFPTHPARTFFAVIVGGSVGMGVTLFLRSNRGRIRQAYWNAMRGLGRVWGKLGSRA